MQLRTFVLTIQYPEVCGKVAGHGGLRALQKAPSTPLRAQIPIKKFPREHLIKQEEEHPAQSKEQELSRCLKDPHPQLPWVMMASKSLLSKHNNQLAKMKTRSSNLNELAKALEFFLESKFGTEPPGAAIAAGKPRSVCDRVTYMSNKLREWDVCWEKATKQWTWGTLNFKSAERRPFWLAGDDTIEWPGVDAGPWKSAEPKLTI